MPRGELLRRVLQRAIRGAVSGQAERPSGGPSAKKGNNVTLDDLFDDGDFGFGSQTGKGGVAAPRAPRAPTLSLARTFVELMSPRISPSEAER